MGEHSEDKKWYKDGLSWRHESEWWEIRDRGCSSDAKGDLTNNTMYEIMFMEDKSDWAYRALDYHKELLIDKIRWPNRMNQPCDSKNLIDFWWHNFLNWGGANDWYKYRPQRSMTRDPYTYFYTCCIYLGKPEYIKEVPICKRNFRIGFWAWRKCLIKKTWWAKLLYMRGRKVKDHPKDYVDRLRRARKWAYENA